MVYTKTITESSGGSIAAPSLNRMPVTGGLIYRFELYLPPGSAGLLKVAVKHGDAALYPSEPGEWFFGNNSLITFEDRYLIGAEPYTLNIWSYNEDTAFDHEFQIRVGLVSNPLLIASFIPDMSQEDFVQQIAEIIASQNTSYEVQRARIKQMLDETGD